MGVKVRARYEGKVLRPFQDLDLHEGEEVEIEVQRSLADKFHGRLAVDRKTADEIVDMEIWD